MVQVAKESWTKALCPVVSLSCHAKDSNRRDPARTPSSRSRAPSSQANGLSFLFQVRVEEDPWLARDLRDSAWIYDRLAAPPSEDLGPPTQRLTRQCRLRRLPELGPRRNFPCGTPIGPGGDAGFCLLCTAFPWGGCILPGRPGGVKMGGFSSALFNKAGLSEMYSWLACPCFGGLRFILSCAPRIPGGGGQQG